MHSPLAVLQISIAADIASGKFVIVPTERTEEGALRNRTKGFPDKNLRGSNSANRSPVPGGVVGLDYFTPRSRNPHYGGLISESKARSDFLGLIPAQKGSESGKRHVQSDDTLRVADLARAEPLKNFSDFSPVGFHPMADSVSGLTTRDPTPRFMLSGTRNVLNWTNYAVPGFAPRL